ncbi:MFS transporter [Arthrobacter sp. zg-Y820]|uniref:MFS transporter n=1 Tax=unclassified Arthrobacter TaxID=235627 RepID=UPI001E2DCD7E|nr:MULTISPECIES: MFS transporter [unclassified Arthrobacter]MCC9196114.1 MFS transporter [Arthrobacter sp. zg-Y820]MDK1278973.1 MFS transporter [Arthrobacter sp. zg.Y820]WIB08614.1 MFS transporter [Arthrobacter sp. zg-Y820]
MGSSAAPRPAGALSAAYRALTLGILAIITCSAFEAMAVTTAMPVVAEELSAGAGYGLAFSMFLTASLLGTVVAGSRCDVQGPLPSLAAGLALMTAGLVLSALAGEFWIVTAGRAVSGLGGGAMIVAVYVIIGEIYPAALQPVLFGWLATAWILPSMAGPLAAGLLAQYVSWRWVFAAVIPIVLVAGLMVWPRVRSLGAPDYPALDPALGRRRALWGTVLAAAVFAAQWAGNEAALASSVLLWSVAAVGAAAAGVALGRLLPAGTLRLARGLPSVVATRGLLSAGFVAAEAFLPLMVLATHGVDPATAGLALTAGAVGWAVGSFLQARAGGRRHRLLVIGATMLAAAVGGIGLLTSPSVPFWVIVVVWSFAGAAMGLALSSTSVMVLALSTSADRGRNSASLQISDQVGAVAGTTVAGILFALLQNPAASGQSGVFSVMWLVLAIFACVGIVSGARSAIVTPNTGKVPFTA